MSLTEGKNHTLLLHSSILASKVILFNLTGFQIDTEWITIPSLKKEKKSLPHPEPFQHKCIKRTVSTRGYTTFSHGSHHLVTLEKPRFQNICASLTSRRSMAHPNSAACFHPATRQWRLDSCYSMLKDVF